MRKKNRMSGLNFWAVSSINFVRGAGLLGFYHLYRTFGLDSWQTLFGLIFALISAQAICLIVDTRLILDRLVLESELWDGRLFDKVADFFQNHTSSSGVVVPSVSELLKHDLKTRYKDQI